MTAMYRALLRVGGDIVHGTIAHHPQETDCRLLLETLRGLP